MENQQIYAHVDHTQLKPFSTWQEIDQLCREAIQYRMATVCIPPAFVEPAHKAYPDLAVCTVAGFPLGYNTLECKVFEAARAVEQGALEVDMVINLGDAKAARFDAITAEIAAVKRAVGDKVLKVIVETCYLNEEEKIALCGCVTEGGAQYIKTSTGFGSAGADLKDIELFKQHIGPGIKIKASGGIRTREAMEAFIRAGCDRIGASAAITALEEQGE